MSEDDGWNVSLEAEFVVAVSLPDLLDWMSAMDGVHGSVQSCMLSSALYTNGEDAGRQHTNSWQGIGPVARKGHRPQCPEQQPSGGDFREGGHTETREPQI